MRLGHLTDLHLRRALPGTSAIAERRSRDMPDALDAALARMRGLGCDAVALTGDLLDVPDHVLAPEDPDAPGLAAWRAAALEDYRWLRHRLEAAGLPWLALPGNHDQAAWMRRIFPEDELRIAGHRLIRFCDREHPAGRHPRRVGPERHRFDALLADAARPQVHLQHFLIAPRLDEGYPHTYLEGEWLAQRIAAAPQVRLVLSGHYHPGTPGLALGAAWCTAAPAFCQRPHPFRVYELGADAVATADHALAPPARTAVFLDRDGVIAADASFHGLAGDLRLIPGAAAAIARLRAAGHAVVVVTNQTLVGLGYSTRAQMDETHDRMAALLLAEAGPAAQPDAVMAAIGAGERAVHPSLADDREAKPGIAMVERARTALGLAPGGWFVGDRPGDLRCGRDAGCRTVLVRSGDGRLTEAGDGPRPDATADDLAAAATLILG